MTLLISQVNSENVMTYLMQLYNSGNLLRRTVTKTVNKKGQLIKRHKSLSTQRIAKLAVLTPAEYITPFQMRLGVQKGAKGSGTVYQVTPLSFMDESIKILFQSDSNEFEYEFLWDNQTQKWLISDSENPLELMRSEIETLRIKLISQGGNLPLSYMLKRGLISDYNASNILVAYLAYQASKNLTYRGKPAVMNTQILTFLGRMYRHVLFSSQDAQFFGAKEFIDGYYSLNWQLLALVNAQLSGKDIRFAALPEGLEPKVNAPALAPMTDDSF